MILHIGIDPGRHGAVAGIDSDGQLVMVRDMPMRSEGKLVWTDSNVLAGFLMEARGGRPAHIWLERSQSMPRQGIVSAFNYGVTFGAALAACERMASPLHLVAASVWKNVLGLSKDKMASLNRARLLWPDAELHLAKHEGRSEALLIAEYGRRQYAGKTQS